MVEWVGLANTQDNKNNETNRGDPPLLYAPYAETQQPKSNEDKKNGEQHNGLTVIPMSAVFKAF